MSVQTWEDCGQPLGMANTSLHYTVPGLDDDQAARVVALLQSRLHADDLHLTLKHVH